jgi:hypothetical protein
MTDLQITGDLPRVVQVELTREGLAAQFRAVLDDPANNLLVRVERELKAIGWTDEEIRTAQLLIALRSNASLKAHAEQLERSSMRMVAASKT